MKICFNLFFNDKTFYNYQYISHLKYLINNIHSVDVQIKLNRKILYNFMIFIIIKLLIDYDFQIRMRHVPRQYTKCLIDSNNCIHI